MAMRTQQCSPAIVDSGVPLPLKSLACACLNAAQHHAVNATNTCVCALQWRMKPSAHRTTVMVGVREPVVDGYLQQAQYQSLGMTNKPCQKQGLKLRNFIFQMQPYVGPPNARR